MKRQLAVLMALLTMMVMMGCEDSGEQVDSELPDGVIEEGDDAVPVAEVTAGETTVRFFEAEIEGEKLVSMTEIGSAYLTSTPLDYLMSQELTSLEIFRALAPDQEAPEALIAAHDREVRQLNRDDNAVRTVDVALEDMTEKSTTTCSNWVFSPPSQWDRWGWRRGLNNRTTGTYLPASKQNNVDWTYYSGEQKILGACNEGSINMNYQVIYRTSPNNGWQIFPGSQISSLIPGQFAKTYVPAATPAVHAVYGNGNNFHLRTGFWYPVVL